jgi:hypothetical protein
MDYFLEKPKQLPVRQFDVVVAGGGTAGVIAAIASARVGAKTALIESKGYFGGTLVEGGTALHSFYRLGRIYGEEPKQIVKGLAQELVDRLVQADGCSGHVLLEKASYYDEVCTAVDVEIYKLVAAEMLEESGVHIFLNTLVVDADVDNGHLNGVIVESRAGREYFAGKVFIDATGWGDLSAAAKAPFTEPKDYSVANSMGVAGVSVEQYAKFLEDHGLARDIVYGDRDGKPHEIIKVGVDMAAEYAALRKKIQPQAAPADSDQAKYALMGTGSNSESRLPEGMSMEMAAIGMTLNMTTLHDDYFMFIKLNYAMKESITNRDAFTKVEVELRKRQKKAIDILRKYIPGCERAFIARSSPSLCTRRGRCVECDYDISPEDISEGRHFSDDIMTYGFHDLAPHITIKNGTYGIPLRALFVKDMDNLFAVGMMITSDYTAYQSTRNTVACMGQGQAAGTCAALATLRGELPRAVPFSTVKERLLKDKVYIKGEV